MVVVKFKSLQKACPIVILSFGVIKNKLKLDFGNSFKNIGIIRCDIFYDNRFKTRNTREDKNQL